MIKHERQIIQCPMRLYGLVRPEGLPGGPLSVIKQERQIIQCCMRLYGLVRPEGLPGGSLSVIKHGDRIARQAMLATMKMQREEADKAKAIEDAEHGDEWAQLLNMQ